jgi:hypothetical protein
METLQFRAFADELEKIGGKGLNTLKAMATSGAIYGGTAGALSGALAKKPKKEDDSFRARHPVISRGARGAALGATAGAGVSLVHPGIRGAVAKEVARKARAVGAKGLSVVEMAKADRATKTPHKERDAVVDALLAKHTKGKK